jgi:hypothetical protein
MKNFCRGLTAATFATLFGLPALAADPVTIHF